MVLYCIDTKAKKVNKMLFVELTGYGDFDMKYTDSVWFSDTYSHISEAGIQKVSFRNDADFERAKKHLKEHGFIKVKTQEINVGGNL